VEGRQGRGLACHSLTPCLPPFRAALLRQIPPEPQGHAEEGALRGAGDGQRRPGILHQRLALEDEAWGLSPGGLEKPGNVFVTSSGRSSGGLRVEAAGAGPDPGHLVPGWGLLCGRAAPARARGVHAARTVLGSRSPRWPCAERPLLPDSSTATRSS
jgi:hypothetical protein